MFQRYVVRFVLLRAAVVSAAAAAAYEICNGSSPSLRRQGSGRKLLIMQCRVYSETLKVSVRINAYLERHRLPENVDGTKVG